MRTRRAGGGAILVELDTIEQVIGLDAALRRTPPAGTVDLVPAARTVLVVFDPAVTTADRVVAEVSRADAEVSRADAGGDRAEPAGGRDGPPVEVAVIYDGADVAEVAELTGLSETEVVARHRAGDYRVAFCGFAPGFAYIVGGDPALRVPRRSTPRTRVPAGSVAIADEFTGVYPREMPGGWQLIGHTDAVLWDLDRDPPALLPPGARVRFVEAQP